LLGVRQFNLAINFIKIPNYKIRDEFSEEMQGVKNVFTNDCNFASDSLCVTSKVHLQGCGWGCTLVSKGGMIVKCKNKGWCRKGCFFFRVYRDEQVVSERNILGRAACRGWCLGVANWPA
jgi:hypothetical protein